MEAILAAAHCDPEMEALLLQNDFDRILPAPMVEEEEEEVEVGILQEQQLAQEMEQELLEVDLDVGATDVAPPPTVVTTAKDDEDSNGYDDDDYENVVKNAKEGPLPPELFEAEEEESFNDKSNTTERGRRSQSNQEYSRSSNGHPNNNTNGVIQQQQHSSLGFANQDDHDNDNDDDQRSVVHAETAVLQDAAAATRRSPVTTFAAPSFTMVENNGESSSIQHGIPPKEDTTTFMGDTYSMTMMPPEPRFPMEEDEVQGNIVVTAAAASAAANPSPKDDGYTPTAAVSSLPTNDYYRNHENNAATMNDPEEERDYLFCPNAETGDSTYMDTPRTTTTTAPPDNNRGVVLDAASTALPTTTTSQRLPQPPPPPPQQVIDILDGSFSDEEDDDNGITTNNSYHKTSFLTVGRPASKRRRTASSHDVEELAKNYAAVQAFQHRKDHVPDWMKQHKKQPPIPIRSSSSSRSDQMYKQPSLTQSNPTLPSASSTLRRPHSFAFRNNDHNQYYNFPTTTKFQMIRLPQGFVPTWKRLLPNDEAAAAAHYKLNKSSHSTSMTTSAMTITVERRCFQLSLLNINEFTIIGLPTRPDGPPTSLEGLRIPIRKISKSHGKAIFDQGASSTSAGGAVDAALLDDNDNNNNNERTGDIVAATSYQRPPTVSGNGIATGAGRWRIPLGAYHALMAYLTTSESTTTTTTTKTRVIGIPPHQLQIASLERARQEKGFPSTNDIVDLGVPHGLAKALAPFQRGGVDFVVAKKGRALLADEMGLGKTVQAIASMAVYYKEWPLLVLSPSSARYHWESEFVHWLGIKSPINKDTETPKDRLIDKSQIHVLTSSRDMVLPNRHVRIVICSYGLAPALAENGSLKPGQFQCAIVDESHMLKSKSTKRTLSLTPILCSTNRCVLLSGTPALSRPAELWPQLMILGTELWEKESDFFERYVKHGNSRTRAELHALLTGTVMIRRLKQNILSTMKPKRRYKVILNVMEARTTHRGEFHRLLQQLRKGRGVLGKLARKHVNKNSTTNNNEEDEEEEQQHPVKPELPHLTQEDGSKMSPDDRKNKDEDEDEKSHRTNTLSRLYSLTGEVKIPAIADTLNRWLDDPTKGKVCIFAHHLSVLDAIGTLSKLSNDPSSSRKFIRIDGSTLPKIRQEQIMSFQHESNIRVALLGITAAGVAVTLTASATVWFAELFWTPAIMIQAEDRCHRIGQQGQVECLYFVGKGTLDDVLWQLLEKKFQQLGQFVEGRDKEKMIVHKTYQSAQELQQCIFTESRESIETEDAEEADTHDADPFGSSLSSSPWGTVDALEHVIEELGEDERQMLKKLETAEDDEAPDRSIATSNNPKSSSNNSGIKVESSAFAPTTDGKMESPTCFAGDKAAIVSSPRDAVITLSDDDDDDNDVDNDEIDEGDSSEPGFNDLFHKPLTGCRIFRCVYTGPPLDFSIVMLRGRAVVLPSPHRQPQPHWAMSGGGGISLDAGDAGTITKLSVGDVLVMIGNKALPLDKTLSEVRIHHILHSAMAHPPMHLIFADDPEIRSHVETVLLSRKNLYQGQQQQHYNHQHDHTTKPFLMSQPPFSVNQPKQVVVLDDGDTTNGADVTHSTPNTTSADATALPPLKTIKKDPEVIELLD